MKYLKRRKNSSALLRKTVNVLVKISKKIFCKFQIKFLHGSDNFRQSLHIYNAERMYSGPGREIEIKIEVSRIDS